MDVSPDALGSTKSPDVAIRAIKDITYGSVRPTHITRHCSPYKQGPDRRDGLQGLRAPFRSHQSPSSSSSPRFYRTVRWADRLSGEDLAERRHPWSISCKYHGLSLPTGHDMIPPQGLPVPVAGAMAENASLFLSYNEFQNLIRWTTSQPISQPLSLSQLALAGAGAGAVTSFLLYVSISILYSYSDH